MPSVPQIGPQGSSGVSPLLEKPPSKEQLQMAAVSLASAGGQSRKETKLQKKPAGAKIKG
jgi:hypothetical protein